MSRWDVWPWGYVARALAWRLVVAVLILGGGIAAAGIAI